jgi:hypothetical protein
MEQALDRLTRAFYELMFENRFIKAKADEFQNLFSLIMEKGYPGDFIPVRPWGKVGDRKNDGYLRSKRILFQCYGPDEMKASECLTKIDEDFAGALPYWKEHFNTWVFVHNTRSLGPDVTKKLLDLSAAHQKPTTTDWGFEALRQELFRLPEAEIASLLGPAPSQERMISLGLEELEPIIGHIARMAPPSDPDLRPVPADKLARNLLSPAAATLLTAGMTRADLLRDYFRLQPLDRDRIAETFRSRYDEIRGRGAGPDEVLIELQRFATGSNQIASASRQEAILAVLAYFFEECDIFERPEGGVA